MIPSPSKGGSHRDWEDLAEAYAEVAWLRDLALHVAIYLERLGNRDPEVRRVVRPIAQRIRRFGGWWECQAEWRPQEPHRPK